MLSHLIRVSVAEFMVTEHAFHPHRLCEKEVSPRGERMNLRQELLYPGALSPASRLLQFVLNCIVG